MNKPAVSQVSIPASNYSTNSYTKTGIVLHWIVGSLASCDKTFQDPNRKASTQYAIGKNGEIHQYVADNHTAYHAGVGSYNRTHFGIEHEGGHLYNGERVKPSPACHQASIKLVAWLCKTYNIPCDRKHIIRHKETGYATECCGTLDIDYIVSEAYKLLHQPPMAFNYDLYLKGTELYMRVTSGSINANITVKNVTKGTSWQVFCNKTVGNDGGPISVDTQKDLYEVNALGVVKQFDNRPAPTPPTTPTITDENLAKMKTLVDKYNGSVFVKLTRKEDLTTWWLNNGIFETLGFVENLELKLKTANAEVAKLNASIGGLTTDRNKYQKLSEELQSKLDGETLELNRLKIELEDTKKALEVAKVNYDIEAEAHGRCMSNQQPLINENEDLKAKVETLNTELDRVIKAYTKLVQDKKGIEIRWGDIRIILERFIRKIKAFFAKQRI